MTGPYTPIETPFACPLDQGGAIDPSGFSDSDGSLYVVYKIDGNSLSLGPNAPCGNADGKRATPLMLQQVNADGTTPNGKPVQILDRGKGDGPLYDTSYATSSNLKGPYTKTKTPLLLTGSHGLMSPGGATVSRDGSTIVYHADKDYSNADVRRMYMNSVQISGTTVSLI